MIAVGIASAARRGVTEPERREMSLELRAPGFGREWLQAGVERGAAAFGNGESAPDGAVHETGEQPRRQESRERSEPAGESAESPWPDAERGGVEERQVRDALGCFDRESLDHTASHSVSHEAGAVDPQVVEERAQGPRMRRAVERAAARLRSTEAGEVQDHEPVAVGEVARDRVPESRRGRETVDQDEGNARAPGACGIVIQPFSGQIDELTSHAGESGALTAKWYP
jgi:hypothetical protein